MELPKPRAKKLSLVTLAYKLTKLVCESYAMSNLLPFEVSMVVWSKVGGVGAGGTGGGTVHKLPSEAMSQAKFPLFAS